jgi:hypothetical protein
VTSANPRVGGAAGGDRITIQGAGFGGTMFVLFGGVPGTAISVVSGSSLMVTTPPHVAGTVAVQVSKQGGNTVNFAGGFTFQGPAGGGGPAPTTTTKAPTTTAPGGGAGPTTTVGGPTTTTAPAVPQKRFTLGGTETNVDGLRLKRVVDGPALAAPNTWASRACATPACPGTEL